MATKGWSFGALTASLKGAAFLDVGTVANTVAAGNDGRIVNALQNFNNLGDVSNAATARTNLSAAFINGNASQGFACTNSGEVNNAVNNARLNFVVSGKADKNGSQYEQFNVGGATSGSHAVRLDQFTASGNANGGFQSFPGRRGQWCRQNLSIPGKTSVVWYYPYSFPTSPLVLLTCLNGPQNMWIAGGVGADNVTIYNDDSSTRNVNVFAIL